jgi:hypothetical protein
MGDLEPSITLHLLPPFLQVRPLRAQIADTYEMECPSFAPFAAANLGWPQINPQPAESDLLKTQVGVNRDAAD